MSLSVRALFVAALLSSLTGGCGAPLEGSTDEVEVQLGSGKADGPALAPSQALLLSGTTQTRDDRTGKITITQYDLRLGLDLSPQNTQPGQPVSMHLCELQITGEHDLAPSPGIYARLPAFSGALRFFSTGTPADGHPITVRTAAPISIVIGANLAHPQSDPLPEDPEDPRVIDVDADGQPGASLHNVLGSIFAAVRVAFHIDGLVVSSPQGQLLRGAIDTDALDVVAYGDSILFYDAVESLADARAHTELVSQEFTFRTDAIASPSACAAVRAVR